MSVNPFDHLKRSLDLGEGNTAQYYDLKALGIYVIQWFPKIVKTENINSFNLLLIKSKISIF